MAFIKKKFDWILLLFFLSLIGFGILSIYTASATKIGDDLFVRNFYIKQIIWLFLALIVLTAIYHIPFHVIDALIIPTYFFTLSMLIFVLLTPAVKGSHRWFRLGFFNFQPSEFAKLVTVLMLSKVISKPKLKDWDILKKSFLIIIPPFVLVLMEPDLGTALTLIVIFFAVLSYSNLSLYWIVILISPIIMLGLGLFSIFEGLLIIFIVLYLIFFYIYLKFANFSIISIIAFIVVNIGFTLSSPIIWNFLHGYQKERILTFIDPMRDPLGSGYQIIQSKIAIGSGGIFGKGILEGTQKNMDFIPEHHTDFIFSVIGEELGFIGCIFLIVLYFLFFSRMAYITKKFVSEEKKLVTVGILSYFLFHVIINIGMNVGVMPITGIPLPFISYGGSNLLINTLGIAIILKLYSVRRKIK